MKCLLLDVNYLAYRAYYTTGQLSYKEVKTGVIYGLLRDIINLQSDFHTNHIAFCFDVGVSKRKVMYPEYKANRYVDMGEDELMAIGELKNQVKLLRRVYLRELGYTNIFWQKGYEADDIIASVINEGCKEHLGAEFIIVSGDQDMFQLLRPNVTVWNPTKKKMTTLQSFKKEYGINAKDWAFCKAIAGCKSDNVKGIYGVGEKTACKFIRKELDRKSKAYKDIEASIVRLGLNLAVVKLPLEGVEEFHLDTDNKPNLKGWHKVLEKFGIKSLRGKVLS